MGLWCLCQLTSSALSALLVAALAVGAVVLLGLTLRGLAASVAPREPVALAGDGLGDVLSEGAALQAAPPDLRLLARALVSHGRHLFQGSCDDGAVTNLNRTFARSKNEYKIIHSHCIW